MEEPVFYSMTITWSVEDEAFLVSLPEWDDRVFNPVTHGRTYEEAAKNGAEALRALIASVRISGEALPVPRPVAATAPS